MGKSTISMAIFNSKLLVHQSVFLSFMSLKYLLKTSQIPEKYEFQMSQMKFNMSYMST